METKIKKSSHYVLPPWPLQEIAWIYYISRLVKHLIMYWWRSWAGWYRDYNNNKHKKYFSWYCLYCCTSEDKLKNHLERCKLHMRKEYSSQKLTTRRGVTKSNLQKHNTNYVYLLSTMWISKAFYVNKTCLSYRHQNLSPPIIRYHVGAASKWNELMGNILNHPKWIWGMMLLKCFWTKS